MAAASRHRSSLPARAFSSVTPGGILAIFGVALVFSVSRTINGVLVSIRDGHVADWLLETGNDFSGHALMALVMIAVIAPVMSLGPPAGRRRWLALVAAVVAGALLCALVRIVIVDMTSVPLPWPTLLSKYLVRFSVRYGYMAALVVVVIEFYRNEQRSIAAMHDAEVDRLALDREMSVARLQVLQAQIEPHFLFNTLANVRRLAPSSGDAVRCPVTQLDSDCAPVVQVGYGGNPQLKPVRSMQAGAGIVLPRGRFFYLAASLRFH